MITKIDWISFTVLFQPPDNCTEKEAMYHAAQAISDLDERLVSILHLDTVWEAGNGRPPYRTSWRSADGGTTIFTHPNLSHALIEISGRGCENLAADGVSFTLLRIVRDRLTRVDVACDMLCETDPITFALQRPANRFRSHSEVVSESGKTAYVGARSSNRYARVYRYEPPHERAHLLRCEFVVKGEDAKLTADAIARDGLQATGRALGDVFGWSHASWQPDVVESAELTAWRPERREGKTLFWLADTVAPLLVRLHREGVIDVHQWLTEHVIPSIITDSAK